MYERTQYTIISSVLEYNLTENEHMDVQVVYDTNHTRNLSKLAPTSVYPLLIQS